MFTKILKKLLCFGLLATQAELKNGAENLLPENNADRISVQGVTEDLITEEETKALDKEIEAAQKKDEVDFNNLSTAQLADMSSLDIFNYINYASQNKQYDVLKDLSVDILLKNQNVLYSLMLAFDSRISSNSLALDLNEEQLKDFNNHLNAVRKNLGLKKSVIKHLNPYYLAVAFKELMNEVAKKVSQNSDKEELFAKEEVENIYKLYESFIKAKVVDVEGQIDQRDMASIFLNRYQNLSGNLSDYAKKVYAQLLGFVNKNEGQNFDELGKNIENFLNIQSFEMMRYNLNRMTGSAFKTKASELAKFNVMPVKTQKDADQYNVNADFMNNLNSLVKQFV